MCKWCKTRSRKWLTYRAKRAKCLWPDFEESEGSFEGQFGTEQEFEGAKRSETRRKLVQQIMKEVSGMKGTDVVLSCVNVVENIFLGGGVIIEVCRYTTH